MTTWLRQGRRRFIETVGAKHCPSGSLDEVGTFFCDFRHSFWVPGEVIFDEKSVLVLTSAFLGHRTEILRGGGWMTHSKEQPGGRTTGGAEGGQRTIPHAY